MEASEQHQVDGQIEHIVAADVGQVAGAQAALGCGQFLQVRLQQAFANGNGQLDANEQVDTVEHDDGEEKRLQGERPPDDQVDHPIR